MIEQREAERVLGDMASARIKGDVAALAAFFHDDVRFKIVGFGDAVAGREPLRATLQNLVDQFAFLEWRQIEIVACGDKIAARHRLKVRHNPSATIVETETAEFLTLKDGKCASFVQFADTALIAGLTGAAPR